jgi:hypothetical protein
MEATVLKVVRLALATITERLLTILAMGMTFGLSAWVMREPTWERMAMAAFFAVCVFLPCAMKERRDERRNGNQELN